MLSIRSKEKNGMNKINYYENNTYINSKFNRWN